MDCLEFLREQPDKSFDLAVVDPPYAKAAGMPIAFRHGMRAAVILSFGLQCIL